MVMEFQLPSIPSNWDTSKDYVFHKKLAKCHNKPIEPAGHAFIARVKRHASKRTLAEDYALNQALLDAAGGDDNEDEDEPETAALLSIDPSNWKKQDHYAVMGLSKKRYLATDDDIKRAYRKKVLKHHPDKKAHLGGNDNFFKCIQKAWEILTDPKRRLQFDSCDPTFDESIPNPKDTGDFYEMYGPVFARNARFSTTPNVPDLGNAESSRESVEGFYQFWFAFDSWRTFEYLDEEDTDKSGSRDEKRWLDKKNVAARKKHKKDDIIRLNKLIEQAFALDPRIKAFKAQDKYAKEAKKREREAAANAEANAAAEAAEQARLHAEEEARIAKEASQKAKELKESAKNAVKKERKNIRRLLRDYNNFLPESATEAHILVHTEKIETIIALNDVEYLEDIRIKFETVLEIGHEPLALVLEEEHYFVTEKNQNYADLTMAEAKKSIESSFQHAPWTPEEEAALKEAVKTYPSGTADRWHLIATAVAEKTGSTHTAHGCIHHAKKIQAKLFPHSGKGAPKPAATATPAPAAATPAPAKETKPTGQVPTMLVPEKSDWTTEQQLQLEAALKKFPASGFKNADKRWEKVASEITGKDKHKVKERMKVLNDLQQKKNKK